MGTLYVFTTKGVTATQLTQGLERGSRYFFCRCRLPVPDAGCRWPVAGCRLPVAGCRLPDAGCRCQMPVPDAGGRMLVAGCRMPVPDAGAGCRWPVAGAGCRWPVAGKQKMYIMERGGMLCI